MACCCRESAAWLMKSPLPGLKLKYSSTNLVLEIADTALKIAFNVITRRPKHPATPDRSRIVTDGRLGGLSQVAVLANNRLPTCCWG